MSIASGFTKMKNYILTSSGYKLLSRWTSSQTVHMGDGTDDTDTVEYRFGAMKGVTSSLATDNDEFALSASAGKNLQDQCTQLNQSLTNIGVEEYLGSTTTKGWAMVEVTNLNKYKSIRIYATSIDNTNNRLGMNEIPVSVLINGGSVQFHGALNISKLIDVECKYNNSTLNIYSDGNTRAAVYGIY